MTGSLKVVLRLPKSLQKPGASHDESTSTGSAEQRKPPPKRKRGQAALSPDNFDQDSGADVHPPKRKAVERAPKGPLLLPATTAKPPKITIKQPIASNDWGSGLGATSGTRTGNTSSSAKYPSFHTPKSIKLSGGKSFAISPEAEAIARSISVDAKAREKQGKEKGRTPTDNPHSIDLQHFNKLKAQEKPRGREGKERSKPEKKESKGKGKEKATKPTASEDRKVKLGYDFGAENYSQTPSSKAPLSGSETEEDGNDVSKSTPAKSRSKGKNQRTPEKPPDRIEMERVIDKIQKKDVMEIFKEPVTEDVAPGYFTLIKIPMDFIRMREKLKEGCYTSWDALEDDLVIMFTNAMTYNTPDTIYYKQARTLMDVAKKLVELSKQGITNFRGRTAGIVRQHNAKIAEEEKREREQQKQQRRVERQKARTDKINHKVAVSFGMSGLRSISLNGGPGAPENVAEEGKPKPNVARPIVRENDGRRPLPQEENVRNTYKPKAGNTMAFSALGGLANGATAEGVSFSAGRPVVKTVPAYAPHNDAYLQSIAKFVSCCGPAVKNFMLTKLADCVPVEPKKPKKTVSGVWVPPPPGSTQSSLPQVPQTNFSTSTPKPQPPYSGTPSMLRPPTSGSQYSHQNVPSATAGQTSAPAQSQPQSFPSKSGSDVLALHQQKVLPSTALSNQSAQALANSLSSFPGVPQSTAQADYNLRLNAALSALHQSSHPLSRGVTQLLTPGSTTGLQQPAMQGVNPLLQQLASSSAGSQQHLYSPMPSFSQQSNPYSLHGSQVLSSSAASVNALNGSNPLVSGNLGSSLPAYAQNLSGVRVPGYQGLQGVNPANGLQTQVVGHSSGQNSGAINPGTCGSLPPGGTQ